MKINEWWSRWGNNQAKQEELTDDTKVFKRAKLKSPPLPQVALVVIDGPDQGREFLLAPITMRIGRQMENHIQLNDPQVSREHAVLQYHPKKKAFLLKDLGSTNGTFFNDQRIEATFVSPGDEIKVGGSVLKVLALDQERSQS
ncbi:MAG: FHA domain-containing protein [Firmicutes bacterium]|nr:FHA domain-containing protein [Bacillota bacterium]